MRVLLYDLEVSPMLAWAYDRWDTRLVHVEQESKLMSLAWKWLDETKVHVLDAPDVDGDEQLLVVKLWELLDEADIVIAHNASRFDNKVSNERMMFFKLNPPSPYRTIDTLTVSRRFFKNSSNSLEELCKKYGIGSKTGLHHKDLWRGCMKADGDFDLDSPAWGKMKKYNKRDVLLLEALYLQLRPWIKNHPLVSHGGQTCTACGSRHIQSRGYNYTNGGAYRRWWCVDCGSWMQERMVDREEPRNELKTI